MQSFPIPQGCSLNQVVSPSVLLGVRCMPPWYLCCCVYSRLSTWANWWTIIYKLMMCSKLATSNVASWASRLRLGGQLGLRWIFTKVHHCEKVLSTKGITGSSGLADPSANMQLRPYLQPKQQQVKDRGSARHRRCFRCASFGFSSSPPDALSGWRTWTSVSILFIGWGSSLPSTSISKDKMAKRRGKRGNKRKNDEQVEL